MPAVMSDIDGIYGASIPEASFWASCVSECESKEFHRDVTAVRLRLIEDFPCVIVASTLEIRLRARHPGRWSHRDQSDRRGLTVGCSLQGQT